MSSSREHRFFSLPFESASLVIFAAALVACGGSDNATTPGDGAIADAGGDALVRTPDATPDSPADASSDVVVEEAAPDVAIDAGSDASADAANDAVGDGGSDATIGEEASTTYPAYTPEMPQIAMTAGGAVIPHPTFVPVYFAEETAQAHVDGLVTSYLGSSAWTALSEYGVGAATQATSIVSTDKAGATVTDAQAKAWLITQLDGTHPEFGPLDATTLASKVFVLFYPSTTSLTSDGQDFCTGAWWENYCDATTSGGTNACYILVPRCAALNGLSGDSALTYPMSGGMAQDATDLMGTTFSGFDNDNGGFAVQTPDLITICGWGSPGIPSDVSFAVSPLWSNKAAAARENPCVPAPPGPYFTTTPVLPDTLTAVGAPKKGVLLAADGTATVDLQLWSTAPTSGPWSLSLVDESNGGNISGTFTPTAGVNGYTAQLAITTTITPGNLGAFAVISTLGDVSTVQWVVVGSK